MSNLINAASRIHVPNATGRRGDKRYVSKTVAVRGKQSRNAACDRNSLLIGVVVDNEFKQYL